MIESSQNKMIKLIQGLKNKKERDKHGMFLLEGTRLVSEIPTDFSVEAYIFSASFYGETHEVGGQWNRAPHVVLTDQLFHSVAETVNPQGIMAICHKRSVETAAFMEKENPFFLVLENVMDPGNMGTMIRSADAAGVDCVFLSKGCVDIYNGKVLRSTMGSIFHLPIVQDMDMAALFAQCKAHNIKTVAAHLGGETHHYAYDFNRACAILIGNEATGLSEDTAKRADCLVKIPMPGRAESLNASVACGVLLYEAVRQRCF